ncbi:MAG: hypothetical protein A3C43_08025 [Candidatus Schekmanbacteria bacterium RIFCSPHIGHO2_02_FULL_38_11]|uniref:Uncharacterized protein n=1 Tax=Candidatus Schekmanbacteria bacterium RIFCSPLOWO2_12_FULL_38_15 TaxID=1817883 RepID=A0A1F7SL68_9BACT|nr:MAG: hypothetical protein A2043_05845 [Candidatus Schekmanbacteria bacterium GWA2_38_9]OGL48014.1 MAG: hypothetical protein A3H37_08295 [Candidatus Schekmanbacteria bacterium RIFCSPLOWO2_02_FULL_38_14]OGL48329.1 MAG: hypothetical protein A3C43_08025 [Candidatus Schekmanbacteria bacterium RIFCSPHIGHO2_02_FULL_38_11]OGL54501.1 MAG: hypothetical protein A3G31_10095 [Candidatus Schekmanbacteria bacterium RIFCSPLOWO2_12_FULL_38_15]
MIVKEQKKYLICELHCRFYKKGKKEESACRGFEIMKSLLDNKMFQDKTEGLRVQVKEITFRSDDILKEIICKKCDFFIDGCDFRDPDCNYDASPCGGFILLSYLFEKGVVSKEGI